MIRKIKRLGKKTKLYVSIRGWSFAQQQKRLFTKWEKDGRPDPPPHLVKQQTIKEYAEKFGLKILVETGTYYGDMVEAMKSHFEKIFSIELDKELCEMAVRRFSRDDKIKIIQGDSGKQLKCVLPELNQPALFWLDGHYSAGKTAKGAKDTPIFEELTHIFNDETNHHVVLVDDARCFGTDPGYPSVDELKEFVREKKQDVTVEIALDSIRIVPESMSNSVMRD